MNDIKYYFDLFHIENNNDHSGFFYDDHFFILKNKTYHCDFMPALFYFGKAYYFYNGKCYLEFDNNNQWKRFVESLVLL